MTIMTVAICDDVQEDALSLQRLLKKIVPEAEAVIFNSGEQLLEAVVKKEKVFSAVFLDIYMPGIDGLETAGKIREKDLFLPVIFVTKSEDFYRQAYDLYALNYLVKPVTEEALERVMYPLRCKWGNMDEGTVYFRYRSQVYTIRHNLIKYVSSSLHTVNFHLTDGRLIHCRGKLDDFNEQFTNSDFVRCHQSFL